MSWSMLFLTILALIVTVTIVRWAYSSLSARYFKRLYLKRMQKIYALKAKIRQKQEKLFSPRK